MLNEPGGESRRYRVDGSCGHKSQLRMGLTGLVAKPRQAFKTSATLEYLLISNQCQPSVDPTRPLRILTSRYRDEHEPWTIPTGLPDSDLRPLLIQRINEIDHTKREIKTQVHEANVRAHEEGRPRHRAWQVRAQDKDKHLTREREEIRKVLGEVNALLKWRRRHSSFPSVYPKRQRHSVHILQLIAARCPAPTSSASV